MPDEFRGFAALLRLDAVRRERQELERELLEAVSANDLERLQDVNRRMLQLEQRGVLAVHEMLASSPELQPVGYNQEAEQRGHQRRLEAARAAGVPDIEPPASSAPVGAPEAPASLWLHLTREPE